MKITALLGVLGLLVLLTLTSCQGALTEVQSGARETPARDLTADMADATAADVVAETTVLAPTWRAGQTPSSYYVYSGYKRTTVSGNPTDVINVKFQVPVGNNALSWLKSIVVANGWRMETTDLVPPTGWPGGVSTGLANVSGSYVPQASNFSIGQDNQLSDNGWWDTTPGQRCHIRVYTVPKKDDTIYLVASTEFNTNQLVPSPHTVYSFNGGRNWLLKLIVQTMDPTLASIKFPVATQAHYSFPVVNITNPTNPQDWNGTCANVRIATNTVKTPKSRALQNSNYLVWNTMPAFASDGTFYSWGNSTYF